MGLVNSSSKPLAANFGEEEAVGRRGPTLGSVLIEGNEAGTYKLVVVTPLKIQVYDAHTAKLLELQAHFSQLFDPFLAEKLSGVVEENGGRHDDKPSCTCKSTISELELEVQRLQEQLDETLTLLASQEGRKNGSDCVVCMAQPRRYAFTPCGHRCVCHLCAVGVSHTDRRCPICRTKVVRILRIRSRAPSSQRLPFRWDLFSFHLPSSDQPVAASSLVVVPQDSGLQLWTGLDVGSVAVFELETGMLVRSLPCGEEMVVALAFCEKTSAVFALSAHKRVTIWDTDSFSCLQKYPAELMTCGADLSAMGAFDIPSISMSLLVLAGVDGSLCLRRITRREDRRGHSLHGSQAALFLTCRIIVLCSGVLIVLEVLKHL
eukprot:g8030.t1